MKRYILLVDPAGATDRDELARAAQTDSVPVIPGRLQDICVFEYDESGMIARKMDPALWNEVMEHIKEVRRLCDLTSDGAKVEP